MGVFAEGIITILRYFNLEIRKENSSSSSTNISLQINMRLRVYYTFTVKNLFLFFRTVISFLINSKFTDWP